MYICIYIYIYIYIYMYIYIYICIYIYYVSPQWRYGSLAVYALGKMMYGYHVYMYIMCCTSGNHTSYVQVQELPQSHCDGNRDGTLFS